MHRRIHASLLAALTLVATALHAEPPDARYCEVAIELSLDDKPMASPSAVVEYGREAEVTIGDPSSHAWRLRIVADAPTVIHRATVIPVSVTLDEIARGEAYPRASPAIKAVPGQRVDVETIFANGDGRRAHIAVVANPKTDAEIEAMRASSGDDRNP